MAAERIVIRGVVKNGAIVPQSVVRLPDGMQVGILLLPEGIPDELRTELDSWDRAGEEAWSLIDEWEQGHGLSQ
jgi:hypothetical protein